MKTEVKPSVPEVELNSEPEGGSGYLYLDIETLPHWDNTRFASTDRRLKDPEKIRESAEKAWLRSSLEPEYGCVLTIGHAIDDEEVDCIWYPTQANTGNVVKDAHITEISILEDFSNKLINASRIVTWAGKVFDLPFLIKRYIKHRRYGTARLLVDMMKHSHTDMKEVWQFRNYREDIKLHDAAHMLDVKIEAEIDGSQVFTTYCGDQPSGIQLIDFHCKQDVRLLRDIHRAAMLGGMV